MEAQYDRFIAELPDHDRAARTFVEHWSGAGTWDTIVQKAHPVMVGEKTLVAPRATARLFVGAFGARTVVVPGAAHMIPLTHPTAVVDALLEADDA